MKIKKDNLVKFLRKIKMKDEQEIVQCLMDFNDGGLKIVATSMGQHCRVSGTLFEKAFLEYQAIGKIGINDFPKFVEILERMGKVIHLELKGSELNITDGDTIKRAKSVPIPLIAEDFFNERPDPVLAFIDTFNFTMEDLREVFDDANISKDSTITILTEPGKVIFTNTGKYKFRNEYISEDVLLGTKSTFGKPIISALTLLDDKIKIHLAKDYPIEVHEDTDLSHISIIIAPIVSKEDEESVE